MPETVQWKTIRPDLKVNASKTAHITRISSLSPPWTRKDPQINFARVNQRKTTAFSTVTWISDISLYSFASTLFTTLVNSSSGCLISGNLLNLLRWHVFESSQLSARTQCYSTFHWIYGILSSKPKSATFGWRSVILILSVNGVCKH